MNGSEPILYYALGYYEMSLNILWVFVDYYVMNGFETK
jgi:hypothetical protein